MNPSFHFLSLLVLLTPTIQGKVECFCIYLSSMLYNNLFLFFSPFYNHLKRFLKFRPPIYHISEFFPTSLFISTPPRLFGTREFPTRESKFLDYTLAFP